MQVDGKVVNDSIIINEFLEDAFPEHPLLPTDPHDRAAARRWIDYINKLVVPAFVRLLQAQDSELEKQAQATQELQSALEEITRHRRGHFFFGDDFSLVDATIAPWVVRDFIARDFRRFRRECVPGWADWAATIESRKSVQDTSSVSDPFLSCNMAFPI